MVTNSLSPQTKMERAAPSPSSIDFIPGEMLGCVSGKLGLQKWADANGHQLVVTADKDGENCELDKELVDADYVISQPFYPAYMTRARLECAKKLENGTDSRDWLRPCR